MDDTKRQQQQPQSKGQQQIDIETLLTQGIDRLGLKINDRNAGDLLGQLLGQAKKQQPKSQSSESEERHFYPKLDDLDIDTKPKQPPPPPPPSSNQPTNPINLDNVINQGIDAIGTALKGNAGSIFGSFLKNTVSTKSSSTNNDRHHQEQPRSSQSFPEPKPSSFKQVD
ncbi:hypothetical protein BLA29_012221, partial [Euroglyphus maynei]